MLLAYSQYAVVFVLLALYFVLRFTLFRMQSGNLIARAYLLGLIRNFSPVARLA